MRQGKIKCNVRERQRVKEDSIKMGGGGRWPLLETFFFPPERKGASLRRSIVLDF